MTSLATSLRLLFLSAFIAIFSSSFAYAEESENKQKRVLGVLALQGVSEAFEQWQGLVSHLNKNTPDYHFELRALNFDEIESVVDKREIDYLIANSAYFVDLRHKFNLHAIATLNRQRGEISTSEFGGLIVTQPHISEAQILNKPQLKIAAVAPLSFGGYLTQQYRLINQYNLDPESHSIQYFFQHNDVLNAMRSGIFDIGFVRTGIYEQYPERAGIKPIFLNKIHSKYFPLKLSTFLYPEWPFARLQHIKQDEAKQILPKLLNWSSQHKKELLSWNAPLNYQPVDDLFQALKLPPYENGKQSKIAKEADTGLYWLIAFGLILLAFLIWLYRLRQSSATASATLQQKSSENTQIETQVATQKAELKSLDMQLQELTTLVNLSASGLLICDAQQRIQFSNRTLQQLLGYSESGLAGLRLDVIFPTPEQQKLNLFKAENHTDEGGEFTLVKLINRARKNVCLHTQAYRELINGKPHYLFIFRDNSQEQQTTLDLLKSHLIIDFYLQNARDIVFSFSEDFLLQTASSSAQALFDFSTDSGKHVNWINNFVDEDERDELILLLNESRRSDTPDQFSTSLTMQLGPKHYLLSISIAYVNHQELDRPFYLAAASYIESKHLPQSLLGISSQNFDNVVTKNQAGILMVSKSGIIEMVNPAAQKLLGRSIQQLIGSYFGTPALSDQGEHSEFEIINPDGSIGIAEVTFSKTEWEGKPAYLVMMYDITQLKEAQKQIEHQAMHDALTALPNRRLLNELLQNTITRHQRQQKPFALLFFDIDGFKNVNDSLGHQIGDLLLIQVAQRVQNAIRQSDILARMGGDEFTIITENQCDRETLEKICENIIQQFEADFEIEEHNIHISISIGVAIYPDDSSDSEDLLKMADLAMFQAKKQVNKSYDFFHKGLLEQFQTSYNMETGLKKALKNNEFELYYQPQVDANSKQLSGLEALIRWNHPEEGMIRPDQFIPLLESTGLIIKVGAWVLEEAVRQLKEWEFSCTECARVAVNVSALQLIDENFVQMVESTLAKHKLPATHLAIEITESILIGNKQKVLRQLTELKELGIQVHMDDFGTGYSSMAMLTELPFDVIKIDQSFVKNIMNDQRERTMVKAIVDTVHAFGRTVLVEGVELEEQRAILAELGCNEIQGYLFDKPLTAQEFGNKYILPRKA